MTTASDRAKDFKKWLKQRKKPKKAAPGTPRQSLIRQQILAYFEDHETGTNAEIAAALGYKGGPNVSTMTTKMRLEGVLEAELVPNPGHRAYQVFRKA